MIMLFLIMLPKAGHKQIILPYGSARPDTSKFHLGFDHECFKGGDEGTQQLVLVVVPFVPHRMVDVRSRRDSFKASRIKS